MKERCAKAASGKRQPEALAASQDGAKLYVSHEFDGAVSVIDAATEAYFSEWANNTCALLGTPSWSGYGHRIKPHNILRVGTQVASGKALPAPPSRKALPPGR